MQPTASVPQIEVSLDIRETMSRLHYFFALLLSSFSWTMAHVRRGTTKWGEPKNATVSNRDNLPAEDCGLASRILDRIRKPVIHKRRPAFSRKFRPTCQLRLVNYGRPCFRTSQIVMPNTVGFSCLGETFSYLVERPIKRPQRDEKPKQGVAVVLATFHRVRPLAGLTLALASAVSWIALLGYVAIKLF